jgi:hypothetical protein
MLDDSLSNSATSISPLQRKLNVIDSIFVRHDDIQRAWKVLDRTHRFGLRLNEASTGYIYGHSRCGKTEVTHRFIQSLTGKRPVRGRVCDVTGRNRGPACQLIEGNGVKIVYLDLTNGASPLAACKEILQLFSEILPLRNIQQADATGRVIRTLIFHEVDMLIVDEAQQAFKGHGENAPLALGQWLLPMENAKAFTIVLVGSPDLKRLFQEVPAARQRHRGLAYLKPFDFKTEVDKRLDRAFVEQFIRDLPFDSTCLCDGSGKVSERRLFDLYFTTRGVQGELPKLCVEATVCGFERCGRVPNTLILQDFIDAFEYLFHDDERMKGVNPFATADLRNIPTIPLSLKDAEREEREQARTSSQSRKMKGGRIRD